MSLGDQDETMKKGVFLAVITVFLIVAVVLVGRYTVFSVPPPDLNSARNRVENLSTLTTSRYEYRDVIFFGEETRLLGIPTGNREMLFAIRIDVIAGLHLTDAVSVEVGGRRDRELFVTLPAPEVIRVEAREETIDQYFARTGLRGVDWLDVSEEVERAKERDRRDALERGILDKARLQGEFLVRELLLAAGYEVVHIRFKPPRPEGLQG